MKIFDLIMDFNRLIILSHLHKLKIIRKILKEDYDQHIKRNLEIFDFCFKITEK